MRPIEKARIYAGAAHASVGQLRKYTFEPYITHPIAVSQIVQQYGGTDDQMTAALLHDVVEDTGITIEMIREEFSASVADMVDSLTDISKPEDGSRAIRKGMDRDHMAEASIEAQFVKCADLIHNSASIIEHGGGFAAIYLGEKKLLLDAMTKVHGTEIHTAAMALVPA